MSTSIPAHFDGEFFVPDAPVATLRPGDRVEVVLVTKPRADGPCEPAAKDDPLLALLDFAVDTGISDLAENADHYF